MSMTASWNRMFSKQTIMEYIFVLFAFLQGSQAGGYFELEILSFHSYRGDLANGECCSSKRVGPASKQNSLPTPCLGPCNVAFRLCLREHQDRMEYEGPCTFGNASTAPVYVSAGGRLGDHNSAGGVLEPIPTNTTLIMPLNFAWTVSKFFITHSYITCLMLSFQLTHTMNAVSILGQ